MNEEKIHDSVAQEIARHLQIRKEINGGKLSIIDVINEARYSLAVNVILAKRQTIQRTGGLMKELPPLTITCLFEGMNKALKSYFPNNFTDEHFDKIKEGYNNLMEQENTVELINNHYNDLFQDYSYNIL